MDQSIRFDAELIRRYDRSGPRYTSYPTAVEFHPQFGAEAYQRHIDTSNAEGGPLSLYLHLPFCDTVCYYCACNKIVTKNRSRAAPYLNRLHREIAMLGRLFDSRRRVEQLHWGGGTPTFISHEQMAELMAATRRHFDLQSDDEGEFSIEVDPREVQADTIALLRELGFNRLSLGVQDFDPLVQRAVNRIQTEEETFDVMEAARRSDFRSISVDLIYGLPHQTVVRFGRTLDKVIETAPDRLSVFNYAHLPERFKTQRQIDQADLPSPAEKLEILQMTIERLTQEGYLYIGMDHFARPDDELASAQRDGRLYRNFQGYSTHAQCDLIGLGVTSIGSVGNAYIQNQRDLEEYNRLVDEGRLPVLRGVELQPDDLIRRAVITQLICHFSLDLQAIEQRWSIRFAEHFQSELEALRAMEEDGLLNCDDYRIEVTAVGRLLIRNICMVFDRYLSKQRQQYSKVI
jgi:oxygen-independent coproporphyrinogen III oxidase